LKWGCEKPTEGVPALGFCDYNVIMKLYNFEKYYLRLALHKTFLFLDKIFKYKIAQYLGFFILFIVCLMFTAIIMVYFFLGVNAFLDKIHLGQYKIMEFQLMQTKVDLKPFYKK